MSEAIKRYFRIGDNLKKIRIESKLNQTEFSKMLEVARSTYSNYENNNRVPDEKTLERMSKILNISIEELLGAPREIMDISLGAYEYIKSESARRPYTGSSDFSKDPIVLDIYNIYKQIFNNFELEKSYNMNFLDFFYSDLGFPVEIVSSTTALILGMVQQNYFRIEHEMNIPYPEDEKVEIVYHVENAYKGAEKPIELLKLKLGEEESDVNFLKQNILNDLNKLIDISKNKDYLIGLSEGELIELYSSLKSI